MDVIKTTGLESIEADEIFCDNISILSSLIITGSSTLNNTTILSTLNVVGDIVSSGVSIFSLNVRSINVLNNHCDHHGPCRYKCLGAAARRSSLQEQRGWFICSGHSRNA